MGAPRLPAGSDVLALVPDDRRHDCDQFVGFSNERTGMGWRTDSAGDAHAQARPRLAALFQRDRTFRDEIRVAFSGPRFLEHCGKRETAADKLRHHQTPDAARVVQCLTERHNMTGKCERAVADILAVFKSRWAFGDRRVVHVPVEGMAHACRTGCVFSYVYQSEAL
jgi:hypothetical protein